LDPLPHWGREVFCCFWHTVQAHHTSICYSYCNNDLITTYLRLIEEKKIAKALQYWPLIEKLQSPAYAKKHWQEMLPGGL
jgi:hypothetical protein